MATETKRYNGWTNYETWNVNLWMRNDEGSYTYYSEMAQEVYDAAQADDNLTKEQRAVIDLAERLKEELESASCDLGAAALSKVNWPEIAAHYIEDVDKE